MEIAEKQKIQIIALQETKLNEKYNLKYKNYNILRKDRNKEGGGLAFLIKNLYYEDIAINIPNTSDLEAQGIKVYLNQNKTINIFNMYHPPNNKLIDDGTMAQFLTDNTIIVGDLNAKHQLWGCSTPNPRGKILSNLFDDNAFMCLNDGNPTHHSYSYNTAQALDISFSSPDIFHKCKWQILKSIGSDHLPILIEISTKTKTSSIKEKFWNFKKANWNLYQQNTNEDFRKEPTRINDLEQNWLSFKNTIIKAAKVSIPRGNIKKWIPNYTHQAKDIQTLITKRNELQKKYTQNQTNCRTELNIVNAKIKRLYVNMKREKWKQTCENLNPRNPNTKLWHLAKQIDRAQPQTENTNMIKNIDGTPATNDKNAANLLGNSYQISSKIKFEIKDKKVEKKARKIIHDCKNVTSTYNIFHEKINMKELDYALENTDLNKTPGPDGIHGQMISNLGKNGKEKLLDIFNNSWKTGKLPQDWKTATIIPIKKLDKSADDPKNYRPISLTSICCKLMEKIILRRLTYHLDTRNLLPEEQYGFRKGHGTIDQLLFFTQKVKDAQNRKPTNHTIAAFLDLTQAFDKSFFPDPRFFWQVIDHIIYRNEQHESDFFQITHTMGSTPEELNTSDNPETIPESSELPRKPGRIAGRTNEDIQAKHLINLQEQEERLRASGVRRSERIKERNAANVTELSSTSMNIPKTYREAMNTPFSDQWKEAMEEEFHSLTSHNVWTLVPKPENENLIKGKWIFNIKMNPDGSIDKRKARFVAMGHNQKLGVDYEESFAPVMKLDSLRTLIAIASQQNMKIEQYDVKTAYLNAELKDDVYLEQPEGFVQAGQENKVCKLNRSLYGLPQSGRCWNEKINQIFNDIGLRRLESEPCAYILQEKRRKL
ncbi:hypothetical protein LAZ67_9002061 [Cordylochernes scorpioides]|uniref:Reverse transcriptase n=1 Tax=Cordylochernes scorpioides TaxID=51811 RepID=A0ABY6KV71_9ARAC|nr:hypothetical protein LAZ67_9002061 [Cordylochernes scorpioides]